jgi:hypothetical protein
VNREPFQALENAAEEASTRRERGADRFLSDLFGDPGPTPEEVDAANEDATTSAAASGATTDPALCARDVAVTDTLALLVADAAPLPVTPGEVKRVAGNSGARDDYKSVAAIVPTTAEPRLLLYFHGNNNYVTVAPNGDVPAKVDASGHSRVPRWADDVPRGSTPSAARRGAAAKMAAPLIYKLDALAASQSGLSPADAFAGAQVKNPVVLVPEDGERTAGTWSAPPRNQYGTATDGKPGGPGTKGLENLMIECYQHLRCLPAPSGRTYLPPQMSSAASWLSNVKRTYVSGHSGGGKPLVEAAGADALLVTPTSAAGVGGRAVDLWLFDCTYPSFGHANYVNFCANWSNAGLLAYRADAARFVCVYGWGDTEKGADAIRAEIATKVLKLSAKDAGDLRKIQSEPLQQGVGLADLMSAPSMVRSVIPALLSSPVVFIKTNVPHDSIPTLFTPLLLRTAAS